MAAGVAKDVFVPEVVERARIVHPDAAVAAQTMAKPSRMAGLLLSHRHLLSRPRKRTWIKLLLCGERFVVG